MYIFMDKVPNKEVLRPFTKLQSYLAYSTENYLYDYLKTESVYICYVMLYY